MLFSMNFRFEHYQLPYIGTLHSNCSECSSMCTWASAKWYDPATKYPRNVIIQSGDMDRRSISPKHGWSISLYAHGLQHFFSNFFMKS